MICWLLTLGVFKQNVGPSKLKTQYSQIKKTNALAAEMEFYYDIVLCELSISVELGSLLDSCA